MTQFLPSGRGDTISISANRLMRVFEQKVAKIAKVSFFVLYEINSCTFVLLSVSFLFLCVLCDLL